MDDGQDGMFPVSTIWIPNLTPTLEPVLCHIEPNPWEEDGPIFTITHINLLSVNHTNSWKENVNINTWLIAENILCKRQNKIEKH